MIIAIICAVALIVLIFALLRVSAMADRCFSEMRSPYRDDCQRMREFIECGDVVYRCGRCGYTIRQPLIATYQVNTMCQCNFPTSVQLMERIWPPEKEEKPVDETGNSKI